MQAVVKTRFLQEEISGRHHLVMRALGACSSVAFLLVVASCSGLELQSTYSCTTQGHQQTLKLKQMVRRAGMTSSYGIADDCTDSGNSGISFIVNPARRDHFHRLVDTRCDRGRTGPDPWAGAFRHRFLCHAAGVTFVLGLGEGPSPMNRWQGLAQPIEPSS